VLRVQETRQKPATSAPDVENIAWGTHICQFYRTADDLTEILLPYFKAGLEGGQLCMWITSAPLIQSQAEEALAKAVPDLDRYLDTGQLEILPHDLWYLKEGVFEPQTVIDGWLEKLSKARAGGLAGTRAAGNMSWLDRAGWQEFMEYERAVDGTISGHELAAICSYSLDTCKPDDLFEVAKIHQLALLKSGEDWHLVENAERRLGLGRQRQEQQAAVKTRDIFSAKVTTVSESFRVVVGTVAGTVEYLARIEEGAGGGTPEGQQGEIRSGDLVEVIRRCDEEIRRRGGDILDRGGLPKPGGSAAP